MSKHKPNSSTKYNQGQYRPKYISKYMGSLDEPIYYRSGWEYKFMVYCDMTEKIKKWGSEIFKINYIDIQGKKRVYIPDFYLETESEKTPGHINKFLVEIKPEKEIREPVLPKTTNSSKKIKQLEYQVKTWLKNKHKWAYTAEWCKQRDIRFWLVTEKHLEKLNIHVPK